MEVIIARYHGEANNLDTLHLDFLSKVILNLQRASILPVMVKRLYEGAHAVVKGNQFTNVFVFVFMVLAATNTNIGLDKCTYMSRVDSSI